MIDCLVLLANTDKLLARLKSLDLDGLIKLVRLPKSEEWTDINDRLTVLTNQLATVEAEVDEPPVLED